MSNPSVQKNGGMMATATGKGVLSQTQVNRMRSGLPRDMQPLSSEQLAEVELAQEEQFAQRQVEQEQFTPPTADQLALQREPMNEFNQNWQAQQQPNLAGYQPQPVPQLPVAPPVAQQPGMWARWKSNMQNALRGGARSVPRL